MYMCCFIMLCLYSHPNQKNKEGPSLYVYSPPDITVVTRYQHNKILVLDVCILIYSKL